MNNDIYEIRYIINYPQSLESLLFKQHSIICKKYDLWTNCNLLEEYDGCIKYFIFKNNLPLSPENFETYDKTKKKFREYNIVEYDDKLREAIRYFK